MKVLSRCSIEFLLLLSIVFIPNDFPSTSATSRLGAGNETDLLSLLTFKAEITYDPLQVMSTWNGSFHFCEWQEYGMGSEVSIYGDVYSYGILLLEIFIGKRPTNEMFVDGLNLHNFAKMALPEQVMKIVDPMLLRNNVEGVGIDNVEKIKECLISIIRIRVACSVELPKERMEINDVVRELQLIKNTLRN